MTTGLKFRPESGLEPSQQVLALRKHLELIQLERSSHKQVLADLLTIQSLVLMTGEQARAVAMEIDWRRKELEHLAETLREKRMQVWNWTQRAALAGERLQKARAAMNERRTT